MVRARRDASADDVMQVLRMLPRDGRPVGLPGPTGGAGETRGVRRARDLGLIELWRGRGWVLTEMGLAVLDRMSEHA